MLSLFPQLFDFSYPTIGILRIIVALVFMFEGKRNFSKKHLFLSAKATYAQKTQAMTETIGGVLLFIGLFTQIVSIILSFSVLIRIFIECYREKPADKRIYAFYILIFFVTISFLFLTPGMLSLDYPL